MRTDAHKAYLWRFAQGVFIVGLAFLVLSVGWPGAMRPEEYGRAAYAIPAEIWALGFMASSGLIIFGLHINGRKPLFTPVLRMIGVGFLIFQYIYLAASSWSAPGGAVIFVFSVLFFLPMLAHFFYADLRLLLARWGAVTRDPR